MTDLSAPPEQDLSRYQRRISELCSNLALLDPVLIAENSGTKFRVSFQNVGEISLTFWGRVVSVPFPGLEAYYTDTGNKLPQIELLLMLYYLKYADRTPETGEWISFSALPDAKFYNQAFQGYTGNILGQVFGNEVYTFENAAMKLGARS